MVKVEQKEDRLVPVFRACQITLWAMCLMLAITLILSYGCATKNLTKEQSYLKALEHYNGLLADYLMEYKLQPPQVQEEWKRDIDPLFKKGDDALKVWKLALGGPDPQTQEDAYEAILNDLLDVLIGRGVVEQ